VCMWWFCFCFFFLDRVVWTIFLRLASNLDPSDLCLLSN
jgi:hypothetical protein